MTAGALHTTWLSLIDRSGPFLSVQVLESALPQGLDVVQTKFRHKLRLAYEEWRDAVDNGDPQLLELHKEWVRLVLWDILEFDNASLFSNSAGEVKYRNDELGAEYVPAFVVKSPVTNKVRFFIDVLPPDAELEKPAEGDKWPASAAEKMTSLCRSQKVRFGLLTNGEKWAVVSAPIGATSGTATWYSRLWRYEPVTLKAFQTLLGARRCFGPEDATLDALLDSSLSSYEEVANTLGEQVRRAVEVLIQSLDSADQDRNRELLRDVSPSELYDASVTVMMRLVFILCAEERGLLLLGDPIYDQFYAVTTLRAQLAEEAGKLGPEVLERRHDAWSRLLAAFRAVYGGIEHETLRLPPLGGSLFDPDKYPFLEGRKSGSSWRDADATPLPIDNRTVLLLLTALQVLEQKGGALHLSYRALDVEQIGHVYEGLLELKVERVSEPTLALIGSKGASNPFTNISPLEEKFKSGKDCAVDYLFELTGRAKTSLSRQIGISLDENEFGRLLLSCGGNLSLANRVKPFFSLLRKDSWGTPMVYQANSYAVIQGANRRETGTHYTPKIFTEMVIAETLKPLVYSGPAEGKPEDQWEVKKSTDILSLRICDPAMGSAAFLVQACRWLAERLVEAWSKEEGIPSEIQKNLELANLDTLPSSTHERILIARRLVAERCLYGVEINPLAVELGKLSLWLTTMAKGKPFDYLEHNIKCGDSLIGAYSLDQVSRLHTRPTIDNSRQLELFLTNLSGALTEAISFRREIRTIQFLDIADVARASALNRKALSALERIILLADATFAANFKIGKHGSQLEVELRSIRETAQGVISGDEKCIANNQAYCSNAFRDSAKERLGVRPFHWVLEYPEIFHQGGFDGIISNPPFRGGTKISGDHGDGYLSFLKSNFVSKQNTDLSAYFFQRMLQITNARARIGMIATKAIAQGDTREASLDLIHSSGGRIYRASPNIEWPGKAAVRVSLLWVEKTPSSITPILHDKNVAGISPLLAEGSETFVKPSPLKQEVMSFKGVTVVGNELFAVSDEERIRYLEAQELNIQVVKRFLIGQDITTSVGALPTRWIIDFADMPEATAMMFEEPYKHVYERVRPFRMTVNRKAHRERWWQYGDVRQGMRKALVNLTRVLVAPQTTKFLCFTWCPTNWVFDQKCVVIATDQDSYFSLLSSNVFDAWTRQYCSTIGDTLSFAPTDSYETFPFLSTYEESLLSSLGDELYRLRQGYMQDRSIGLTEFYNQFHNKNSTEQVVVRLRQLQEQIDHSILKSHGWTDVNCKLDFYPTKDGLRFGFCDASKKIILERLLSLNHLMSSCSIAEGSGETGE